jgi:serine protease inhibitor
MSESGSKKTPDQSLFQVKDQDKNSASTVWQSPDPAATVSSPDKKNTGRQPLADTQSPETQSSLKNKIMLIVLIVIGAVTIGYSLWFYTQGQPQKPPSSPGSDIGQPDQIQDQSALSQGQVKDLSASHTKFAFKLLSVLGEKNEQNIFISPLSINLALSIVYNGADGKTKKEMAQALELQGLDLPDLNTSAANLLSQLKNIDDITLNMANSVWLKKDFIINEDFLNLGSQFYGAEISTLDFSSMAAPAVINKWVADRTENKITDIINQTIDPQVVMYVINAIYFNGTWTYEFDPQETKKDTFSKIFGKIENQLFMEQIRNNFLYQENDDFQAVKLPYGQDQRLSMIVILPTFDPGDLKPILNQKNWDKWMTGFSQAEGTLILPKFSLEYEKSLNTGLKALGMEEAFTDLANFDNLAPFVYISEVKHKTILDVDEKGTEAAGATSVEMSLKSAAETPRQTFYMDVSRPFFLSIYDELTREILFMGFVYEPR